MLNALFKRSSVYFIGLTAGKLVTTVAFILLGRALPLEQFGKGVLFITLASVITFIGDFGMNQWYQKIVETTDKKILFQKMFFTRIFTLLISMTLSCLFLTFTHTFTLEIKLLFLLMLIGEAFLSMADGYYLEKGRGLKVALKPVSKNLFLIVGYFLLIKSFTFETSIYLLVLGSFVTLIWYFPIKLLHNLSLKYTNNIKEVLSGGSHYALLVITSFAYSRGDSLLINYLLNSQALGLYSAAYRYLESVALLPTALAHNLFPVSAKKKGITLNQLLKITGFLTIIGIVMMIFTFITAPFLVIKIFGEHFAPAILPLRIFGVVMLLFFINSPLSTVVQSSHFIKKFLPFGAVNTLLNLGLNFFLIPIYGINGAALSMLITEITGLFINLYFVKRLYTKP